MRSLGLLSHLAVIREATPRRQLTEQRKTKENTQALAFIIKPLTQTPPMDFALMFAGKPTLLCKPF